MRTVKPNLWPHQFVRTNETKDGAFGVAHKLICKHCHFYYWSVYPRPREACPARTDQMEMKRLLG